ncbi:DUF4192 domain-containing protein [Serinibacter salmoneus]|uniref:Uncharacterized protein DUF4192 n=1 Tax=Serinibacter salmoneus TaxID=556530 RepID=A0A2A9CYP7_9MICO|nr:DUF4192 domain-containing protein [Serinibacter salmoneus]PFG19523.1 uncharacterized protein DUF4192 [Serinibacter salmoneus]
MSVPVVSARSPRDLLAFVPHALGFRPRRCVVVLGIRSERGRVGLTTRTDLSDLLGPDGPRLAGYLASALVRDGAREVFVAIYDDRPLRDLQVHDAVGSVLDLLARTPQLPEPVDVVVVGTDRFRSLLCDREECCPAGGRPVAEIACSEVATRFVASGSAPLAGREELAVGREERADVLADFRRERRLARSRRGPQEDSGRRRLWRAREARWIARQCRTGDVTGRDVADHARLAVAVADSVVRDALMMWVTLADPSRDAGALVAPGVQQQWAASPPPAVAPDHASTGALAAWLRVGAALAEGADRARLLAAGGWLAWHCGEGALAEVLAGQALHEDPRHRLASLTLQLLARGVPPAWVHPPGPMVS